MVNRYNTNSIGIRCVRKYGWYEINNLKVLLLDCRHYDALGDIKFGIVTFYTNASSSIWLTKAEAIAAITNLAANGGTNYDEAMKQIPLLVLL